MPKGWRLWLLIALWAFFPILFHPWWLLLVSVGAYSFVVWLLLPPKENSE
jgi:hypothetical protein